ncbi:HAMP domain-containing histidine kinase [Phormidium tenue FACHB-886]|nr:HAMP domain-containing histidine kinase [Phormidium tenue FACHB-886]
MYKWYLPTLSEIIAVSAMLPEPVSCDQAGNGFQSPAQQRLRAEREWSGAIAALKQLLQSTLPPVDSSSKNSKEGCWVEGLMQGMLLSGPFPILDQPDLLAQLSTWTFTVGRPGEMPLQLLPAPEAAGAVTDVPIPTLPLLSTDPLAAEQFCLTLTSRFSVVLVLGETPEGEPAFLFSFDPEVVQQAWRSLQARLKMTAPYALTVLNKLVEQFGFVTPDYRLVTQFSHLMLANLPYPSDLEEKRTIQTGHALQGIASSLPAPAPEPAVSVTAKPQSGSTARFVAQSDVRKAAATKTEQLEPLASAESHFDTELLQAIAHEVRTPLTTIRTLTRLLLRRKDMHPDVLKRLEIIDRECSEQIDRFSLIFRAAELEMAGKNSLTALAPISLTQVLQQNISRWQQQASQHSHTLDVTLPQKLPMVVTDPTMLDQMLTGLVDRITHTLPPGSHIQIHVSQAGHQLKLQLESHPQQEDKQKFGFAPALKSLGQLLMFQPETGNLSLSMAVTKNLFQAVGGKLIVKQRPQQGEVLTIFLPLENRRLEE